MKTMLAALAGLSLALAAAPQALAAEPKVKIDSGTLVGAEENGVRVFRGVPFAAAPVGDLRWRPPQPVKAWNGERQAKSFGAPCMQPIRPQAPAGPGTPSEDCLYANVWAPLQATKAPVMVWIHGGSNVSGSGANYDGQVFARDGVVLISINYRMGAFGFFAHPALTKAAKADEPLSNYAIMDQMAALKWARRNAAAFGGDPNNVTVFGESAGAMDIVALLGLPAAKGLFDKAIVESNIGWAGAMPLAAKEKQGVEIVAKAGAPANATAAQLRALPAAAILANQQGGSTAVDGRLIKQSAYDVFAAGRALDVPLIIGSNSFEASLIASRDPKPTPQQLTEYNDSAAGAPARWIAARSAGGAPSWLYYFSYVREALRPTAPGAVHASEIAFVFDTLMRPSTTAANPVKSEQDQAMAARMHSCWVGFARTGRPACAFGPAWPAYTPESDQLMEFGAGSGVRTHFRKDTLDVAEQRQAQQASAAGAARAGAPARR